MASASFDLFGQTPTTIILTTSDNFNGTAQTADPSISSGTAVFPSQAGGGLVNYHRRPIKIKQISVTGGGTTSVKIAYPGVAAEVEVASLAANESSKSVDIALPFGASLKISTASGASPKTAVIVGQEESIGACL